MDYILDKINYKQRADNCQKNEYDQTLSIELDDAGGGYFIRIITGENGWSIDEEEIDKIARHLKRLINWNDKMDE